MSGQAPQLLARRLLSTSTSTSNSLSFRSSRLFSASAQRPSLFSSSLATIDPKQADEYIKKQRDFRAHLSASKEDAEREAFEAATKVQAEQRSEDEQQKTGPLTKLIYGTEAGRRMDHIERSFSQMLARGKYVHAIFSHTVKPDKVDEYIEAVGDMYPKIANEPANKINLVGSWRTEVGDCDTFIHIWEYQRYNGYHESLNKIWSQPGIEEQDSRVRKMLVSRKTSLMQEFSFWPTTPPRKLGGLFELRAYTLHPGNLLEWETHWRKGLEARKEVMEGVGAWFVQIGELNTVYHLWQFADLEQRRVAREKCWGVEGWSDTVHKTVPLIQSMHSRIMIPMPWSPVA